MKKFIILLHAVILAILITFIIKVVVNQVNQSKCINKYDKKAVIIDKCF